MVRAWHGKCESDTAALCKSNGKDTFQTLNGTAWTRHAMCESALKYSRKFLSTPLQTDRHTTQQEEYRSPVVHGNHRTQKRSQIEL